MGDFVVFRGGECGRFRAMISAIVFGGDCFRARGGQGVGTVADFGCARWALSFAEHEPWGDFLGLVGARGGHFRVRGVRRGKRKRFIRRGRCNRMNQK